MDILSQPRIFPPIISSAFALPVPRPSERNLCPHCSQIFLSGTFRAHAVLSSAFALPVPRPSERNLCPHCSQIFLSGTFRAHAVLSSAFALPVPRPSERNLCPHCSQIFLSGTFRAHAVLSSAFALPVPKILLPAVMCECLVCVCHLMHIFFSLHCVSGVRRSVDDLSR